MPCFFSIAPLTIDVGSGIMELNKRTLPKTEVNMMKRRLRSFTAFMTAVLLGIYVIPKNISTVSADKLNGMSVNGACSTDDDRLESRQYAGEPFLTLIQLICCRKNSQQHGAILNRLPIFLKR